MPRADEEVVVLEVAEQPEVDGEAERPSPFRVDCGPARKMATPIAWFQTIENASRKTNFQSQSA